MLCKLHHSSIKNLFLFFSFFFQGALVAKNLEIVRHPVRKCKGALGAGAFLPDRT